MEFVRIKEEQKLIQYVYDILRLCGKDMFENQGLVHWRTPYPIEKIREDCQNKEVYIALKDGKAIATFQLLGKEDMVELSKFAVLPSNAGKGVGGRCMEYIENWCKDNGYREICLDVYNKSQVAIRFYLKYGFVQTGIHNTKYFQVIEMKKKVS